MSRAHWPPRHAMSASRKPRRLMVDDLAAEGRPLVRITRGLVKRRLGQPVRQCPADRNRAETGAIWRPVPRRRSIGRPRSGRCQNADVVGTHTHTHTHTHTQAHLLLGLCPSSGRDRSPGIRKHEIPATLPLRFAGEVPPHRCVRTTCRSPPAVGDPRAVDQVAVVGFRRRAAQCRRIGTGLEAPRQAVGADLLTRQHAGSQRRFCSSVPNANSGCDRLCTLTATEIADRAAISSSTCR